MIGRLRLELADQSLDFDDRDEQLGGFIVEEWDPGSPVPRENSEPRPGADGEFDYTEFAGGRVVSIRGTTHPGLTTCQQALDRLHAFTSFGDRPWLFWRLDDGTIRRIQLRATDASQPLTNDEYRAWQVSWKAASPFWEAADPTEATLDPESVSTGFTFPLTFDLVFPAGGGGPVVVNNAGNRKAEFVARIFGACEDPIITNARTGMSLSFTGLTVGAGEYVEIDSRAVTVRANGLPGANRFKYLDTDSQWWRMEPGANPIVFACTAPSATAVLEITTRSTWA